MNRLADLARKTSETEIQASLLIDGSGKHEIITPVGFFTHMLETMAFHGRFDLTLSARGEVKVDEHHLVEDTGLVLGKIFLQALGEAKGINRAGQAIIPMDEALAMVAVDLGGRPYLQYRTTFRKGWSSGFDFNLLEDFFQAFSTGLMANVAIAAPSARSNHHQAEAIFKAFGRALQMACSITWNKEVIPSLKGVIDR
jgi:imidazoleglycerol-phosphate dehydratase